MRECCSTATVVFRRTVDRLRAYAFPCSNGMRPLDCCAQGSSPTWARLQTAAEGSACGAGLGSPLVGELIGQHSVLLLTEAELQRFGADRDDQVRIVDDDVIELHRAFANLAPRFAIGRCKAKCGQRLHD